MFFERENKPVHLRQSRDQGKNCKKTFRIVDDKHHCSDLLSLLEIMVELRAGEGWPPIRPQKYKHGSMHMTEFDTFIHNCKQCFLRKHPMLRQNIR